jgi:hypothetical protein
MSQDDWKPFRPGPEDLKRIGEDVSEIGAIQQRTLSKCPHLHMADRVAHQYQIGGGKVLFRVAAELPGPLNGVGLFQPGAEHLGVGRISTGLGTPHIETNPDFLGIRLAFQTPGGVRVDFLGINDPTAPVDDHKKFMDVLHATGESAGADAPVIGDWGEYNVAKLIAEQGEFGLALAKRMKFAAPKTLLHLTSQTIKTTFSSTAYQTYWTGVEEVSGIAGKFTVVPVSDENHRPEFRPGQRHLSEEWRSRQAKGDIEWRLYWIPYLDEARTPTGALTKPWEEDHKLFVGSVLFPQVDPAATDTRLWAILASEMGANPGNWIHDKDNTIGEPATEFGVARRLAYHNSQVGRGALEPDWYADVFSNATISDKLGQELERRQSEKNNFGHMSWDPASRLSQET